MNKFEKFMGVLALVLVLLSGFTIHINNWSWEYKGLIKIAFKMIYGRDLE